MTCDGHPGPDCFHEHCRNWYIENGVHGCSKASANFKAARTQQARNPANELQQGFNEAFKVVDQYRRMQIVSRKAALEALKARVNLMLAKAKRLALEQQLEGVKEAKRTALAMVHPWGWARDLGLNISDYSLEQAAKLQQKVYHADVRPTYLDNPERLALMRVLFYE